MAFKPLQLRFIRFLGPEKEPADYTFTSGLNILWGASDTGKTFLALAIDFMLGAGSLKDIPERVGYDRVLLGITTADGKDYTLQRSVDAGSFKRFDGLLTDPPADKKPDKALSAVHTTKNYNNLSHWLLQQIGLDKRDILWSTASGEKRSLGFRALAHLCVIPYPKITKSESPLYHGQYQDQTREYGVFKLLLTGLDDSALTEDMAAEIEVPPVSKPAVRPEVLEQMLYGYEDELAALTDDSNGLDGEETAIEEELEALQAAFELMEGKITETSQQREEVYDRHSQLGVRRNEIKELQERFRLLDAQYTNDIKRLVAIEESGQLFVLREPIACPLCGAAPEGQNHAAACDGNVTAVAQAAAAEIAKIRTLQAELHDTVEALTKEQSDVITERRNLESQWNQFQQQMETALSPHFAELRKKRDALVERRLAVQQAIALNKRIKGLRRRLDEPAPPAPEKLVAHKASGSSVNQYISKSVLRDISKTVGNVLGEWHFPGATDVYFDEAVRDVVIGGRPRGSRGAGLCAITYSAFTLAIFDYCRSRKMPHPGLVILDSPLIAYKEPKADDEGIIGTDLKLRFYEHLNKFAGTEQIFIIDNTEPPQHFLETAKQFTGNPAIPRCGLFPCLPKKTE
jgi:phage shock protein A